MVSYKKTYIICLDLTSAIKKTSQQKILKLTAMGKPHSVKIVSFVELSMLSRLYMSRVANQ